MYEVSLYSSFCTDMEGVTRFPRILYSEISSSSSNSRRSDAILVRLLMSRLSRKDWRSIFLRSSLTKNF